MLTTLKRKSRSKPISDCFKVSFVIGGAQKGGTTALHQYLGLHPRLYLSQRKELHIFDKDKRYQRAFNHDWKTYHKHFADHTDGQICGEASPAYMYNYKAAKRMWKYNPEMKWLIVLRNPLNRAYSHWNMNGQRGRELLSFGEAIRNEPERLRSALQHQQMRKSYVDRGFYCEQIRRVWHYFGNEQVKIIKSEALREHPNKILADVWTFLDVEPLEVQLLEAHTRDYTEAMEPGDREYLMRIFEHEIKQLEHMLGWDCSDWMGM